MTVDDLQRIHEIDLELLTLVDSICRKENIQYFLFYGSLLGAIRHHGFIPWDDDVDICMTRDNYLRFIDVAPKMISKSLYSFVIMGSGSAEYLSEIKIGKKNTVFCHPDAENLQIMKNVQLDIFCLDYLKQMPSWLYRVKRRVWSILGKMKLNFDEKRLLFRCIEKSNHPFKFLYKIGLLFLHIGRLLLGERTIEKIGNRMFVGTKDSSSQMVVVGFKAKFDKQLFNSFIRAPFENSMFPIPSSYHEVLTITYGDYLRFPDEDHRYRRLFSEWIFKEL